MTTNDRFIAALRTNADTTEFLLRRARATVEAPAAKDVTFAIRELERTIERLKKLDVK